MDRNPPLFTVDAALARLPGPPNELWPKGARSVRVLLQGDTELKLYAPRGHDPQRPHDRDEFYMVARGHARFELDGVTRDVVAGDALFVPAHREHRFVDIADDFATWVVFFGPVGGCDASPDPAGAAP